MLFVVIPCKAFPLIVIFLNLCGKKPLNSFPIRDNLSTCNQTNGTI